MENFASMYPDRPLDRFSSTAPRARRDVLQITAALTAGGLAGCIGSEDPDGEGDDGEEGDDGGKGDDGEEDDESDDGDRDWPGPEESIGGDGVIDRPVVEWERIRIGGGGSSPDLIAHPNVEGLFFTHVDVGAHYRWNDAENRWEPQNMGVYWTERNFCAADSLAIDPTDDGETLFAAVGMYDETWADPSHGRLLKSTDGGSTYETVLDRVPVAANQDQWYGQKIGVDPTDGDRVYFTTRSSNVGAVEQQGTFRSKDGGQTFEHVSDLNGSAMKIDPTDGTVYVGTRGDGVYRSEDGGDSFESIGGMDEVRRLSIGNGGLLVATSGDGVERWDGDGWTDVSPRSDSYLAVSVSPHDDEQIICASHESGFRNSLFITDDGGDSWREMATTADFSEAPWEQVMRFASSVYGMCWSPHDPDRIWFTDWYHPYETRDPWADTVEWTVRNVGHENIVETAAAVPSPDGYDGALLHTGVADNGGFTHYDLAEPPEATIREGNPIDGNHTTTGIDYPEADPDFVVRVGRDHWQGRGVGAYSTDGGDTYESFGSVPGAGGRVAVSAADETIVWATQEDPAGVFYSSDRGDSWNEAEGAPSDVVGGNMIFLGRQPLAADRRDGDRFYVHDARSGAFYRSDDRGRTFEVVNEVPAQSTTTVANKVDTAFEEAGEVWIAGAGEGLFFTTDAGEAFTRVEDVSYCRALAVGTNSPNTDAPVAFVVGTVADQEGIFMTEDRGESWHRLDTERFNTGEMAHLSADRHEWDRCFLGTAGSGTGYPRFGGD